MSTGRRGRRARPTIPSLPGPSCRAPRPAPAPARSPPSQPARAPLSGAARYVGAAGIGDTPKDARVSLELSNAFDVYARARQVSARRIDKRHTRRTVELTLSNEKARPVEVRLAQNLGDPWRVLSETDRSQRLNASTNQWTVKVPAGGEKKLRYTVTFGP